MEQKYKEILQRIINCRRLYGVSQKRMGEHLGITQSQYSKMELGKTEIPFYIVKYWNDIGWDVDYFVTGRTFTDTEVDFMRWMEGHSDQANREMMKIILGASQYKQEPWTEAGSTRTKMALELLFQNEGDVSLFCNARQMEHLSQIAMAEYLGIGIRKYRRLEKEIEYPDLRIMGMLYELSGYIPLLFMNYEKGKWRMVQFLWMQFEDALRKKIIDFVRIGEGIIFMDEGIVKEERAMQEHRHSLIVPPG